jgi:hypothetical protein
MGGVARHLMHVFEDPTLTFADLRAMVHGIVDYDIKSFEKIDGCNIFFTIDQHTLQPMFVRSATDIRNGFLGTHAMRSKFAGHPAEVIFLGAVEDITAHCANMSTLAASLFMHEGKQVFVNCEIVIKETTRLITYDKDVIAFHNLHVLEDMKMKKIDEPQLLSDIVDTFESQEQHTFEFTGPLVLKFKNCKLKADFDRSLRAFLSARKLTYDNTIGDYVFKNAYTQEMKFWSISQATKHDIAKRVVNPDTGKSILEIKKRVRGDKLRKRISGLCTKQNAPKTYKRCAKDLIDLIDEFAIKLLSSDNVSSELVINSQAASDTAKKKVVDCIELIRCTRDGWHKQRKSLLFEHNDQRMTDYINSSVGFSVEGIVFEFKGNAYKLTGLFAKANQIYGLAGIGRGKIPPISR